MGPLSWFSLFLTTLFLVFLAMMWWNFLLGYEKAGEKISSKKGFKNWVW